MKALLLAALCACATARDAALLGGAEALVAVDVAQTLDMNRHPERHYFEANPLLGLHPTDTRILASGIVGAVCTAAVWYVLPRKIRWVAPTVVIVGELPTIAGNAASGLSVLP